MANLDQKAIQHFFQQLGRLRGVQGKIYICGGAALVHAGIRQSTTQDIDILLIPDSFDQQIAQFARQQHVTLEFASPGDFIPLPAQWQRHCRYVGKFGGLEVYYFDFLSSALAKIERATQRDIQDVQELVQQGVIHLHELDAAYQEIIVQMGKGRYSHQSPRRLQQNYVRIRPLL